jgi:hypothetical protein
MRRLIAVCAAAVLTAGLAPTFVPATASTPACRVRNVDTGTTYVGSGANLQTAIDEATSGATLRIRGVCVGGFRIESEERGRQLTLVGVATERVPVPRLDAQQRRRVLTIRRTDVTIRNLLLTNGFAEYAGGGIYTSGGTLTLTGTTVVSRNYAPAYGGGIFALNGTVVLRSDAAVLRNGSEHGGGIVAHHIVMTGASSVGRNGAISAGGIRTYRGTITMRDTATVVRNTAWAGRGGGIFIAQGTVLTLDDSARVTRNLAAGSGGGILALTNAIVRVCSVDVAISPNTPDDPPATVACTEPRAASR